MAKKTKEEPKVERAGAWADDLADVYIDARAGANEATVAYRKAHADPSVGVVAFEGVWLAHPTWQFAMQDGCWDIEEEPASKPPGSRAIIRRKPAATS